MLGPALVVPASASASFMPAGADPDHRIVMPAGADPATASFMPGCDLGLSSAATGGRPRGNGSHADTAEQRRHRRRGHVPRRAAPPRPRYAFCPPGTPPAHGSAARSRAGHERCSGAGSAMGAAGRAWHDRGMLIRTGRHGHELYTRERVYVTELLNDPAVPQVSLAR